MRRLALLFSCALATAAQPVIAPTNATVGSPRGENVGDYNITNWFETGYRFRSVGGSLEKYRSDVNFGNGVRLLGSNLTVNSREGHGRLFDELIISTQGLGNDPYQFASVRLQKNRVYRYDMMWRLTEYYNPALPIAFGLHGFDTTRALQDHSLVLLPDSPFKLLTGFSRVNQNGPALSTIIWPDVTGDEFGLFTNVRRVQDEFRLGGEISLAGAKLTIVRGWEGFRDDTVRTSELNAGLAPGDDVALAGFRRDEPYHGDARSWRANLVWDRSDDLSVRGRFASVRANRNFIFDETAFGTGRFGPANRQILVFGDARRPVTNGSLTLSLFPRKRLTVVNHTAFHNTRMEGDGAYRELDNFTLSLALANFQLLGIRTITNSTDLNVQATSTIGFLAGYQFSNRRIRSVEQVEFEGVPDRVAAEQTNTLHVGRFGVRVRPFKPFSVLVDAEIGRADNPVYPISARDYHAIGGRVQYKAGNLLLSASTRTNYNVNSVSLFQHSSRSRNYAADVSWTVRPWLAFDANYSKLHIDTLTGIAYFYNRVLIENDRSVYISNIHSGTFGARIGIGSRADLFAGYSRVQDVADRGGQRGAAPANQNAVGANIVPGALAFQVFPLTFESPMARLSLRLHNNIRLNFGYQHYHYAEQLLPVQNYRAHTGFTSLLWSF